ncbi:MAG: 3-keto-5-aminohexanoate cleavage protein [Acidiferrobacteraceae bacterium]|nr:3-keto-5-aminohexanoate cleavage protein [Acidiferrobacteraceae bacterium]|tara:strand:- start:200 stop:1027 length:828 start_codon:yes stop_codon:yes gene_type:complete
MSTPCIITVAITGSVPKTKDNPAVPVTPTKQIESTHEAFESGASLVHVHVRDKDQNPSSDPSLFKEVLEGVRKYCPGMIVQFSTGGRGRSASERGSMLHLSPDMASLATGSVNFPNSVYDNHPELIDQLADQMLSANVKPEVEVFDLAMLYNAVSMVKQGKLMEPLHVQFVFGVPNALPPLRQILDFEVSELTRLLPDATWTAAALGRGQLELNHWALELGGHCRTGLEDNIRFDKSRLAKSNAELVARVAELCDQYGRHAANVSEARKILSLDQ